MTSFGRSALHFAAARGSIGCVCLLLERGIDPFIVDHDGKTAQEIAAENGHVHCKRRIWLYRCNLKPIQTQNVGRLAKNDQLNVTLGPFAQEFNHSVPYRFVPKSKRSGVVFTRGSFI